MREPAYLCLNSWAGYHEEPVFIVGETPARYRIAVDKRTKIAGRDRWLELGDTALVPKRAVKVKQ